MSSETTGTREPITRTGQGLDLAWPADVDRLAWRETIVTSGPEPNALTDIDHFLDDALNDVPQGLTAADPATTEPKEPE